MENNNDRIAPSATLVILWAGIALTVVVTSQWSLLVSWFEQHESLAGWAQAFGSVAAIYAAFEVSNRQHRQQIKREMLANDVRARSQRQMLLEIIRLMEVLATISSKLQNNPEFVKASLPLQKMIDHMRSPLDTLPFWDGANQKMLLEALKIRAHCLTMTQASSTESPSEQIAALSTMCIRFARTFKEDF